MSIRNKILKYIYIAVRKWETGQTATSPARFSASPRSYIVPTDF